MRTHLAGHGIQSEVHYPLPDHRQACHGGRFEAVSLPATERESERVLSLPCFPELGDEEIRRVMDACNSF